MFSVYCRISIVFHPHVSALIFITYLSNSTSTFMPVTQPLYLTLLSPLLPYSLLRYTRQYTYFSRALPLISGQGRILLPLLPLLVLALNG
jgi:hypothetical protein